MITLENTAAEAAKKAGATQNNSKTISAWVDGGFAQGSKEEFLSARLYDMAQYNAEKLSPILTALAPEAAPVVRTQAVDHTSQIFDAASSRMNGGVIGSATEGRSSGDTVFERGAVWIQLLANKTDFDGNSKVHGFDSKSAGVAMGAEKQVNNDIKLGVGYGHTNGDIDAFERDIDVDTHTVFAYGEYKPNMWFVNGIASFSFTDYDEHKNVAGCGYNAQYDTKTFGLQAMTGYDILPGKAQFTPTAGLRYYRIHRNGYTDSANQRVSSDDMDVLTAVVGTKVSKDIELSNGMNIKPEVRIAATYDLISDKENAVVGLSNSSSYMIEGERLDRFGFETGVGLTVDIHDNVDASIGYEGKFREDYSDHTGMLSVKYKF